MNKPSNPPAFPVVETATNGYGSEYEMVTPGMTLRDYFAGQALIGLLVSDTAFRTDCDSYANQAGKLADAMLKEKGVNDGNH